MGFDCTFHLVDERSIREEFVPRLLGESSVPTVIERVRKDPPEWWTEARQELTSLAPKDAAVALCNRAIEFSACSLPYHYERGLALSLWEDQEDAIALRFPPRFRSSPEVLFGPVVQAFPALHGKFPTTFEANFMTGVFIPSGRVPEVLGWIEKQVHRFEKRDQRRFKGLLRILRTAVERRLAYWEATDVTVPIMNHVRGDPELMSADFLGTGPTTRAANAEVKSIEPPIDIGGNGVVDDYLISSGRSTFATRIWDLSVWPPALCCTVNGFATSWARSPQGSWLFLMESDPEADPRTFKPCVVENMAEPVIACFPFPAVANECECEIAAFLGSKPLVFREGPRGYATPDDVVEPPLVLIDGRWRGLAGIPSLHVSVDSRGFADDILNGVARLSNGRSVVVWGGDGYEPVGDRFQRTFALGAKYGCDPWTSVPTGPDGFFYLSNRCLHEARRGQKPIAHAPQWKNIMRVRPGPAGSLLLQEGENKDADVAKLYFPADNTFIHIEPELFDDDEYCAVHWNEHADRLIAVAIRRFIAVPTPAVLGLPRHDAQTGRRIKA